MTGQKTKGATASSSSWGLVSSGISDGGFDLRDGVACSPAATFAPRRNSAAVAVSADRWRRRTTALKRHGRHPSRRRASVYDGRTVEHERRPPRAGVDHGNPRSSERARSRDGIGLGDCTNRAEGSGRTRHDARRRAAEGHRGPVSRWWRPTAEHLVKWTSLFYFAAGPCNGLPRPRAREIRSASLTGSASVLARRSRDVTRSVAGWAPCDSTRDLRDRKDPAHPRAVISAGSASFISSSEHVEGTPRPRARRESCRGCALDSRNDDDGGAAQRILARGLIGSPVRGAVAVGDVKHRHSARTSSSWRAGGEASKEP